MLAFTNEARLLIQQMIVVKKFQKPEFPKKILRKILKLQWFQLKSNIPSGTTETKIKIKRSKNANPK